MADERERLRVATNGDMRLHGWGVKSDRNGPFYLVLLVPGLGPLGLDTRKWDVRWAEEGPERVSDDVAFNRLAQYFYEAVSDSREVDLVMNMTAKAALVDILKTALTRAGFTHG